MPETESNIIELHFPLRGESLPSDHGYPLYAAISNLIPDAHSAVWLGIHTIKGQKLREGVIRLSRFAKLRLRLPADKTRVIYKLAGAIIDVAGYPIQCGIPEVQVLKPAKRLRSRLVVIKCKDSKGKSAEADSFINSLRKQITELGVGADAMLEREIFARGQDGLLARRVMRVKTATLTGYGVILDNLNERDSLVVQESGLGGKRRMGCGLFEPLRSGDE